MPMFENTAILSLPFSCCQVFSRSVRTDHVRVFRGLGMKRNMVVQFHFSFSNVFRIFHYSKMALVHHCNSKISVIPIVIPLQPPSVFMSFTFNRFRYTKLSNSLNERLLIVYYFAVTFLGNALLFSKDTFVIPITILKGRKIWTQVPQAR